MIFPRSPHALGRSERSVDITTIFWGVREHPLVNARSTMAKFINIQKLSGHFMAVLTIFFIVAQVLMHAHTHDEDDGFGPETLLETECHFCLVASDGPIPIWDAGYEHYQIQTESTRYLTSTSAHILKISPSIGARSPPSQRA